jgi:hypothetical protein
VSWDQQFYDPIIVPGREPLVTLRDAALVFVGCVIDLLANRKLRHRELLLELSKRLSPPHG